MKGGGASSEAPHPLEVVDDVCRVSVVELGHGDVDELHLLHLQDPDPLLDLSQLELARQLHRHLQNQAGRLINQPVTPPVLWSVATFVLSG